MDKILHSSVSVCPYACLVISQYTHSLSWSSGVSAEVPIWFIRRCICSTENQSSAYMYLVHNSVGRYKYKMTSKQTKCISYAGKKGKEAYLYSAFYMLRISQSAQAWITLFYLQIHHACLSMQTLSHITQHAWFSWMLRGRINKLILQKAASLTCHPSQIQMDLSDVVPSNYTWLSQQTACTCTVPHIPCNLASLSVRQFLPKTAKSYALQCFSMGRTTPKISISHKEISNPPSNAWFLWPTRITQPNSISIGSAIFTRLMNATSRHTERQTILLSL